MHRKDGKSVGVAAIVPASLCFLFGEFSVFTRFGSTPLMMSWSYCAPQLVRHSMLLKTDWDKQLNEENRNKDFLELIGDMTLVIFDTD